MSMAGSGGAAWRVGDVVPAAGLLSIVRLGEPRWYALTVRPQREVAAEHWLSLRGVYAFHPVLRRRSRRAGKIVEHSTRYLPGYVFARFHGRPVEHLVTAGPFVTGAITLASGEWGVLAPRDLRAIHAMRDVDAAADARRREEVAQRRARSRVRAGERAMFRVGPFAGVACEVVELRSASRAAVRLTLFGRETVVEAGPDMLVRVSA